jgi:hypothetical protein
MNTHVHARTHAHIHIQIPFLTVLMMRLYTYHYLVSSLSIIMHSAKVQWFQFQVKMWRKINSPVWQTNSVSIIRDVTMETLSVSDMVVDLNILAWLSNLEHLCQFCCHKSFKIYNDKKKSYYHHWTTYNS